MAYGFDPWSPAFVAHPYDVRGAAHARADRLVPPTNQWLVSRHADVSALLRDRRLGRTYLHVGSHEDFGHPPDLPHLAPFWRLIRNGWPSCARRSSASPTASSTTS